MTEVRFPWGLALLALALAFTLLGARPIWDPDEGRYSNVALNMLESGDWVHPMRNHEEGHWTKPPLTYWAIAASVGGLGYTPFAARLPVALAYLACVGLCWRLARRLVPGREAVAGLAFATMAVPLLAAQVLTTDFLLAAFEALALLGYVEARFSGSGRPRRWLLLMWLGFALAFMTKGPPGLLPLLAVLGFQALSPKSTRPPLWFWPGPVLSLLLGLSWFAVVSFRQPGLLAYYLGTEVIERVAGHGFNRNSQWYGWLSIYGATLVLGSLPWTLRIGAWLRGIPASWRAWRDGRPEAAGPVLVALWLALPLLVLCLARSRLPLYVLPLFVPLAIAAAAASAQPPRRRWLVLVIGVVLGLRIAALFFHTHKDADQWASEIRRRVDFPVAEVVFVDDMARYGLHLHLGAEVEKVSLRPRTESRRFTDESGHGFAVEVLEREPNSVFITKQENLAAVRAVARAHGAAVQAHGAPYHGRVMFTLGRRLSPDNGL